VIRILLVRAAKFGGFFAPGLVEQASNGGRLRLVCWCVLAKESSRRGGVPLWVCLVGEGGRSTNHWSGILTG
jgi:hypothetical protein